MDLWPKKISAMCSVLQHDAEALSVQFESLFTLSSTLDNTERAVERAELAVEGVEAAAADLAAKVLDVQRQMDLFEKTLVGAASGNHSVVKIPAEWKESVFTARKVLNAQRKVLGEFLLL
eukprot:PhM_4_TR1188/c0_g2_i1/m.69031